MVLGCSWAAPRLPEQGSGVKPGPTDRELVDQRISGTIMPDEVREIFYHDCTDADVADASARLRPQALAALMTKV